MGKLFHRSRWNNRKVVTGTIILFLCFVIAVYVERDSFGQARFDSVLGNPVQVPAQAQTSSEAGAKTAVSNLIKAIRSKDIALQQVIEEIKSTKAFNWAIPVLTEILRDEDPDIKFMGLVAIGAMELMENQEINRQSPELKSLLLEIVALVRDKDAVVRYIAVQFLNGTDTLRNDESAAKRAIPALIEYLQYQVEEQDIPHTRPRGIIRLGGQWDDFRQEAASALAKIGPRAVPALMEALHSDNTLIREGAVRALGEIGPQAKQAVPWLLAAKGDNDNRIRFRAAVALWKVDRQAKPAIPILIEFVQTPDVSVGTVAAQILGEMGSQAKEAVLVLAEIMKKDWHMVSSSCAQALGEIGPAAKAAASTYQGVKGGR